MKFDDIINGLIRFLMIFLVLFLFAAIVYDVVYNRPPETQPLYEPDHQFRSPDVTCFGWRIDDRNSASAKFWMCDNGKKLYDPTGVKFPAQLMDSDDE